MFFFNMNLRVLLEIYYGEEQKQIPIVRMGNYWQDKQAQMVYAYIFTYI